MNEPFLTELLPNPGRPITAILTENCQLIDISPSALSKTSLVNCSRGIRSFGSIREVKSLG